MRIKELPSEVIEGAAKHKWLLLGGALVVAGGYYFYTRSPSAPVEAETSPGYYSAASPVSMGIAGGDASAPGGSGFLGGGGGSDNSVVFAGLSLQKYLAELDTSYKMASLQTGQNIAYGGYAVNNYANSVGLVETFMNQGSGFSSLTGYITGGPSGANFNFGFMGTPVQTAISNAGNANPTNYATAPSGPNYMDYVLNNPDLYAEYSTDEGARAMGLEGYGQWHYSHYGAEGRQVTPYSTEPIRSTGSPNYNQPDLPSNNYGIQGLNQANIDSAFTPQYEGSGFNEPYIEQPAAYVIGS